MRTSLIALGLALLPLPALAQGEPAETPKLEIDLPRDPNAPAEVDVSSQAELDAAARAAALRALESDVAKRIDELATLRARVEALLADEANGTPDEIATLIELYSSMKPKNAASVMERLPLPLAAEVLAEMPSRKAGKILDAMSREKAVSLSKRVAGER